MTTDNFPQYSVRELNEAIGKLLERGFAPRFLLKATISKSQLKKGHLWLTLTDGQASITAVIWASKLKDLKFNIDDSDGVLIVGKLNFWELRASLVVQVLDIRPTISTVQRKFEIVRDLLIKEGLISEARRRQLPSYPKALAILTSAPSSALADILRTAKERWPLTKLLIFPIPVQGNVAGDIRGALKKLAKLYKKLDVEVVVLARGGGNREDLMVFDNEELCRDLANFVIPIVTGLGHEDDLTVADLVADHRAATPTAAIVDLLISRESAVEQCCQRRQRLNDSCLWLIRKERQRLQEKSNLLQFQTPFAFIERMQKLLAQKKELLIALSPDTLLKRGFAIVRDEYGQTIPKAKHISLGDKLTIHLNDGQINSVVEDVHLERL